MSQQNPADDARMDIENLYREESITDRRVGSIRVLTPVTVDGGEDTSRARIYIGQASVYTPAGALPLNFELEAATLAEAIEKFPAAANKAVEETMKQLQEMRREAASSLVVPGAGGPGPGGMGGGGIQMP
ncbi:MAG TPA: hypothetical protein VF275_10375 [Gammaproteobacteria bacterium]